MTSSTKKLRVLIVNSVGSETGGAEVIIRLMRDELLARGHDVLVVSTDHKLDGHKAFADVIISRSTALGRFWYQYGYQQLKATIDEFKPDVIHLHTIGEFSAAALWATGTVPTVLTVHGPEPYTKKLLPWMLPGSHFKGCTHLLRDVRAIGVVYYLYLLCLQRPLYRRGFRFVDLFVTPSLFMANMLATDARKVPIMHVYNGMLFPSPPPFKRTGNVLFIGRLEAGKGVETLLRAVALAAGRVDNLSVTIGGDGDDRLRLEGIAADLGLSGIVHFRGWLQREEVIACYEQAEVVAVPSIWPETLGNVALEAMAAGRPVVATYSGGLPEIVTDGVTGRLVPSRVPHLLADALLGILTNPEVSTRMSAASLKHKTKFELDTFVDKMESIYEELARKAGEPA
jgi:glycosyltransferase involved in cell wall biosynthesis